MDFKDLKIDLNEYDIKFLCKQTGLSIEKVSKLTELKEDIDLIIDSFCSKKAVLKDQRKQSIGFYLRYLVFKFSKHLDYGLEEKTYIADCLLVQLPKIFEKIDLNSEKINEDRSQNLMILLGFLGDLIKEIPGFNYSHYIRNIDAGFRGADKRDVALHLDEWIKVLVEISIKDKLIFGPFREKQCNNDVVETEQSAPTLVNRI